jgi:xylulokinase
LYNTDGSIGAARGAGIGCKLYKSEKDAFNGLTALGVTEPEISKSDLIEEAYQKWKNLLLRI